MIRDATQGRARRRRFPKSIFGRILFGLGLSALAFFAAAGFLVFSIWVEKRFPSSDSTRALLPAAQRISTKPLVDALSHQLDAYVRRRGEAPFMYARLSLDETIARFLDPRVDLAKRRVYAYRLARDGSRRAIEALLTVFQNAPPEHKAFMAQLIGSTRNPAAKAWLWLLLDDPDQKVVLGTLRGLSAIGGDDVTSRIAGILTDDGRPEAVRIEAALGLGTLRTPSAQRALTDALVQGQPNDLAIQILNSLSRFEFSDVAGVFEQYLNAPGTTTEMRTAAIDALANTSSEAVPFLLKLAETDSDADARASAAWAISLHQAVKDQGPALFTLVEHEAEPDVRRRLYEALLIQDTVSADQLLPIVESEDDIEARVAGFNIIGQAVRQQGASEAVAIFNSQIVPELVQIATTPNSLNIQMRAVFALRRAQTVESHSALIAIANAGRPEVAAAARNGLKAPNR